MIHRLDLPLPALPTPTDRDGSSGPQAAAARLGGWVPGTRSRRATRRHGLTLTELMVVVAILVIMIAVMVPGVAAVAKGRDVREAARQLVTFLSQAQSQAIKLQRPVGVWFTRDKNSPQAAWQIYVAEVPKTYSGDAYDSLAIVKGIPPGTHAFTVSFAQANNLLFAKEGAITAGDVIRFGNRGPWYEIYSNPVLNSANSSYEVICLMPSWVQTADFNAAQRVQSARAVTPTTQFPFISLSTGDDATRYRTTYEIQRRPRRISTKSLTLTAGMAIDLYWSGLNESLGGANEYVQFRSPTVGANQLPPELVVMFDARGRVAKYYPQGIAGPAGDIMSDVYLLVGRFDQVGVTNPEQKTNLTDLSSLWIGVTQRGLILTGENPGVVNATPLETAENVVFSRQLTQPGRSMGGGT